MNKTLAALLLLSGPALAAWEVVPSGTVQSLHDARFVTPQRGFAVGDRVLLSTSDSGKTWTVDSLSFGANTISFSDSNRAVIAGREGNILSTSDGGKTWQKASTPDTSHIVGTVLFGDGKGLASVNLASSHQFAFWKTSDHGKTWALLDTSWARVDAPGGTRYSLSGSQSGKFCFPSRQVGYVAQRTATLKTTDGGTTWRIAKHMNQDDDYLTATFMNACHFLDDTTGYVTGTYYSGTGFTTDGMKIVSKLPAPYGGNDVLFVTRSHGYLVSSGSISIRRTSDGGITWTNQGLSATVSLNKLMFTDVNRGFAFGSNGLILRTTDGGGSPVGLSPAPRNASRPRLEGLFGKLFDALGRLRN